MASPSTPSDAAGATGQGAAADPQAGDDALLDRLAASSRRFDASGADPERNCWMAVHEHIHGVLPSEYDIREVPEALYLAVLERRRSQGRPA